MCWQMRGNLEERSETATLEDRSQVLQLQIAANNGSGAFHSSSALGMHCFLRTAWVASASISIAKSKPRAPSLDS